MDRGEGEGQMQRLFEGRSRRNSRPEGRRGSTENGQGGGGGGSRKPANLSERP